MDEDGYDDDTIFIAYDERREKKETDTIEMIDFDKQLASSNEVSKFMMDQERKSTKSGV